MSVVRVCLAIGLFTFSMVAASQDAGQTNSDKPPPPIIFQSGGCNGNACTNVKSGTEPGGCLKWTNTSERPIRVTIKSEHRSSTLTLDAGETRRFDDGWGCVTAGAFKGLQAVFEKPGRPERRPGSTMIMSVLI